MPRKPGPGSGGKRQGEPGATYPQRTDLMQNRQPVRTGPSQEYGSRVAQERAQQAVPLPQTTPIGAPTARPNEPLTAGLPMGPGAGPEAVQAPMGSAMTPLDEARAIYQRFPNETLRQLIQYAEEHP